MAKEVVKTKAKKNKSRRNIGLGHLYVKASFNNTLVSLTNKNGDVIAWSSSGREGFGGSKKSTPYAATQLMKNMVEQMKKAGVTQVEVIVSGIGSGRDAVLRVIGSSGVDILSISDRTPVAHNGTRRRKSRRV